MSSSVSHRSASMSALEWAPAQLPRASSTKSATLNELVELARELESVEKQRHDLLAPLSPSKISSLGSQLTPTTTLLPSLVVCEACHEELTTATELRRHQAEFCSFRLIRCLLPGCGALFPAYKRAQHHEHGCSAAERTRHLLLDQQYAHENIECPNHCGENVMRRWINDHLHSHCFKRQVHCPLGCPVTLVFDQIDDHLASTCVVAKRRRAIQTASAMVNQQTVCDWCNIPVLKRKLLDHQEDECLRRERQCPNWDLGCREWIPVGDFAQHIELACCVTIERNVMAARARDQHTLVPCPECHEMVKRRHLQRHAFEQCPSRIVLCKNAVHGCRARLRWRDRHLHEDFMALSTRERSLLQFSTGGSAYITLHPSISDLSTNVVDIGPPWTVEYFLWMVNPEDEILSLHHQSIEYMETWMIQKREHIRATERSNMCKKQLKELKDRKRQGLQREDMANAAKGLAEEFDRAENDIVVAMQAMTVARGWIRILITEAYRIFNDEIQKEEHGGENVASRIKSAISEHSIEQIRARLILGELPDEEQCRMGDLELWARSMTVTSTTQDQPTAEQKKQKEMDQRKLLQKRAELQEQLKVLKKTPDHPESERLRRRYERELAKVEGKLSLVSDDTPNSLFERRGRHVIASSSKNAISLVGITHGQITYYRSPLSKSGREVNFNVSLTRSQWHHVVFSANQKELTLIINGKIQGVKRGVFELPFARIGTNNTGDSFQGYLQEVRYWSSCLTLDQIQKHANTIIDVGPSNSDLLAYYTLEEGMGNIVDDMALRQPHASCFQTKWILYNTPAIRKKFGVPPTPSFREKTSCIVNQRLKVMAQHARDRELERVPCGQNCSEKSILLRHLDEHQRLQCPNRVVPCNEIGCEATYRFCDAQVHLKHYCSRYMYRERLAELYHDKEQMTDCILLCGLKIKKRLLTNHTHHECQNRLIACPQSDCGDTIVAKTLKHHLASECKSIFLARERQMILNGRKRTQALSRQT